MGRMPWWSEVRDTVRDGWRRRAVSGSAEAAADEPSESARLMAPTGSPQAWAVLPAVQRALADPIVPTAPLDAFTVDVAGEQRLGES